VKVILVWMDGELVAVVEEEDGWVISWLDAADH